jgi:hypothetical protein
LETSLVHLLATKFHPIVNGAFGQDESARTSVNPLNPCHKSGMPARGAAAGSEEENKTMPHDAHCRDLTQIVFVLLLFFWPPPMPRRRVAARGSGGL